MKAFLSITLCAVLSLGVLPGAVRSLAAQSRTAQGTDIGAAEKYEDWILTLVEGGNLEEAEAALLRAQDYAAVSSDLAYLLARVRRSLGRPRQEVLASARAALAADRWRRYTPSGARLLEAEVLVEKRLFSEALVTLDLIAQSGSTRGGADENDFSAALALCRLRALDGLGAAANFRADFRSRMKAALTRYDEDSRFLRFLFAWAARQGKAGEGGSFSPNTPAAAEDRELIAQALGILPRLLQSDSGLAPLAAPFIYDRAEAVRLLSSYRASGALSAAAVPVCVSFGVLGEEEAITALFNRVARGDELEKATLLRLWPLLRTESARKLFQQRLAGFSGTLTEDADADSVVEAWTDYRDGQLFAYRRDNDQDGLCELTVTFSAGRPDRAVTPSGAARAAVVWESYPALRTVMLDGKDYRFTSKDVTYTPLRFSEIAGVLPYGEFSTLAGLLTERNLLAFAESFEEPSPTYAGARRRVTLEKGVPIQAQDIWGGQVVAEAQYKNGRPLIEKADLDMDGRFETVRRYAETAVREGSYDSRLLASPVSSESDWDGDGVAEYRETYEGGRIHRFWDLDVDGVMDHEE